MLSLERDHFHAFFKIALDNEWSPFSTVESVSAWMNGSGYIVYNITKDLQDASFNSTYIAIRIRTHADGLVLQTSLKNKNQKDFFMLEINQGSISVRMDFGGGTQNKLFETSSRLS